MSAEENVELARQLYDAINGGDLERFLAGVDPDVEFRSLVAEVEGRVYRGHDGVRMWWRDVAEALGGLDFGVQAFHAVGDDGLVTEIRVKGVVSDLPVEQTMWQAALIGERGPFWWATFRTEDEARAELDRQQRQSE